MRLSKISTVSTIGMLPVEPRLLDRALQLAELQHERLLVLVHDEGRRIGGGGAAPSRTTRPARK